MSTQPEPRSQGEGGYRPRPRHQTPGAHIPERVNHGQIGRPSQLSYVEPQGARRDEQPLNEGIIERDFFAPLVELQVGKRNECRHAEERSEPPRIHPSQPSLLPPEQDGESHRQGDGNRLR